MKPRVAIATGDPAGIGPEISLKAARDTAVLERCRPVLVGDRAVLELHARACGLTLDGIELLQVKQERPELGAVAPGHGRAALAAAEKAIRAALDGDFDAVVGAPHTEAAIHAAGIDFDGYPSFVARVCGLPPEDGLLMLCFRHGAREIRIAHVTLHASVRSALAMITVARVAQTVRVVRDALVKLGVERPRIAVSGLNPHAGESGAFGREEIEVINPALEQARREGLVADGPIGADTLIQRAGYDAYVVMLHDQGHVAAKALAPRGIAALTLGTPVLFSSVGHGSALELAGQGRADATAMGEAIKRLAGAAQKSVNARD
ncbi:MAG TPA: 4-hydroxythreonine-4-phosphate dehydrogenase PdxA [Burkholderiales bacterium]|jgi:4-hydroxy-L-threonine phosphate dehydrogenase PdxA